MTPNEIISKWRGECRHEPEFKGMGCVKCGAQEEVSGGVYISPDATNYENDPSAWDGDLYDAIEEAGLMENFLFYLSHIINPNNFITPLEMHVKGMGYIDPQYVLKYIAEFLRSTPLQKSQALAKSIQEVKG